MEEYVCMGPHEEMGGFYCGNNCRRNCCNDNKQHDDGPVHCRYQPRNPGKQGAVKEPWHEHKSQGIDQSYTKEIVMFCNKLSRAKQPLRNLMTWLEVTRTKTGANRDTVKNSFNYIPMFTGSGHRKCSLWCPVAGGYPGSDASDATLLWAGCKDPLWHRLNLDLWPMPQMFWVDSADCKLSCAISWSHNELLLQDDDTSFAQAPSFWYHTPRPLQKCRGDQNENSTWEALIFCASNISTTHGMALRITWWLLDDLSHTLRFSSHIHSVMLPLLLSYSTSLVNVQGEVRCQRNQEKNQNGAGVKEIFLWWLAMTFHSMGLTVSCASYLRCILCTSGTSAPM